MIGVFDSGVGGLSTLKHLLRILPEYDYLYLADSLRAPYGGKSEESIYKYTKESVDYLFKNGAKVVLLACNTASFVALRRLQKEYKDDKKILGVAIPTAEKALSSSRYGVIGVVGTRQTISLNGFEKVLKEKIDDFYRPNEKKARLVPLVFSKACPLLVPLIEEGWEKKPETKMILKKYLLSLKSSHVDTLVLGCTHYPLISSLFQKIMGKNCTLIDSGLVQAESFQDYLSRHEDLEKILSKNKKRVFLTTDSSDHFIFQAKKFLGFSIKASSVSFP